VEDSPRFAIRPDVFFDFYTNFFALMKGNLMFGQVTQDGLLTREIRSVPFTFYDLEFVRHSWKRIPIDQDAVQNVVATLQPTAITSHSGYKNLSPEKFYDLVFTSQDHSIRRIVIVFGDTYYSTQDWGSLGAWNRVTSRSVKKDWIKQDRVTIMIRYKDDRLIQGDIPLRKSADLY